MQPTSALQALCRALGHLTLHRKKHALILFVPPLQRLDASPYIAKKLENRVDKVIKYMLVAGKKALADAGLPADGPAIKVRRQGGWSSSSTCWWQERRHLPMRACLLMDLLSR